MVTLDLLDELLSPSRFVHASLAIELLPSKSHSNALRSLNASQRATRIRRTPKSWCLIRLEDENGNALFQAYLLGPRLPKRSLSFYLIFIFVNAFLTTARQDTVIHDRGLRARTQARSSCVPLNPSTDLTEDDLRSYRVGENQGALRPCRRCVLDFMHTSNNRIKCSELAPAACTEHSLGC